MYQQISCLQFYPYFYPLQLFQRFTAFYSETRKALQLLDFFDCVLLHFTLSEQFKSGCHLQKEAL